MNVKLLPMLTLLVPVLAGCEEPSSWADDSLGPNVTSPAVVALAEQTKQLDTPAAEVPDEPEAEIPTQLVEPAADPPAIDRSAPLKVKRLIVAEGVEAREPVSAATSFGDDTPRIYAFVEIGNPEKAQSEISISITPHGEAERGRVSLDIGASPRWRTWSFTRLAKKPGNYDVVVYDASGDEIGRAAFEVTDSKAPIPTAAADPYENLGAPDESTDRDG